jgi:predicted dehydrogenase
VNAIGVGIIGLDHWYNALPFIEHVSSSPGFELRGVAHHDEARGRTVVDPARHGSFTTDPSRLLEDPSISLVAIFTTVDENARWCVAASDAGKHVIAGKPLGMTTDEAQAVVDAADRNGVVVYPYESYGRITPLYRTVKRWIEEGRIGTLHTIDCTHDAALPVSWSDDHAPGWWTRAEHAPGGGWIDHSIYQIDAMRYLSGRNIDAIEGNTARLRYGSLPFEDFGHAVLALGTVRGSSKAHWLLPHGTFRRVIEIVGSDGMILFDSVSDTVRVRGDFRSEVRAPTPIRQRSGPADLTPIAASSRPTRPGWHVFEASPAGQPTLLSHVGDVIRGRAAAAADARDGYANLVAALAFYRAATTS